MTFEERIDRLRQRHEALTQSIELLHSESVAQTKKIELLVAAVTQDGENIRALARSAEMHERRF